MTNTGQPTAFDEARLKRLAEKQEKGITLSRADLKFLLAKSAESNRRLHQMVQELRQQVEKLKSRSTLVGLDGKALVK